MIIPLPILWGRQPVIGQPDQIDRVVYNRNYRLIAGLSINRGFEQVVGILFVSVGHGKFIRCRHSVEASVPIPAALRKSCLEIVDGSNNDFGIFNSLVSDLAAIQASVVERLKVEAGKFVDRLLAVAISDPGFWRQDFDGRINYSSFCDAARLAELSGVSVIDNFPAADIAAGGNGRPLEALPFWLLAADRNTRVAQQERFVLQVGDRTTLLRLPVSDGLDAELPEFELWQLENGKFISQKSETAKSVSETAKLVSETVKSVSETAKLVSNPTDRDSRTVVSALEPILRRALDHPSSDTRVELICADSEKRTTDLLPQLSAAFPKVSILDVSTLGCSPIAVPAVLTAILGLMHIDQLPANVPWLTGANSQRILGRVTLGRPSSWRQLVRVMADYQPAAMKLKDAV